MLADKNLKPGDIILMDEPATHLHTQGQEELRLFLKDFAVKNGVTFVLATHSPFFIDLNFLDEIRIVNLEGSDICHIENDFYAIKEDDTDTLLPIKEALTTKSNVLIDNDEIVIFVEGMMDYCYLTAMKFAFNDEFKNLVFIPIFGVGYNQEKSEQKIDKIKNLKKYD
ncbi:ATP-binding protein [bacterium]|nr:ATP-binding protein [bacterium]